MASTCDFPRGMDELNVNLINSFLIYRGRGGGGLDTQSHPLDQRMKLYDCPPSPNTSHMYLKM